MTLSKNPATLALAAALMMLCLTSCGSSCRIIRNDIPITLTAPCEKPELPGETYGDIIRLAYRQRIALAECDARMEAIRHITDQQEDSR